MQFTELKKHLMTQNASPAYIIVGDDAFLRSSAEKMFEKLITQFPELNISILTAPESDQSIVEAVEALPMMSAKRLVIVYDYTGDMSRVIKYLQNPCSSTILIFIAEKLESNFSKAIKLIEPIECDRLEQSFLVRWIASRVKELNAQITTSAANKLIDYCARSLTRISSETEKLCSFKADELIVEADVEKLVTPDIEVKIFELSDALGRKQPERVAKVLGSLLSDGSPIVSLMGMLYSHFRRLLYCSVTPVSPDMAADMGVKEYALQKSREQAEKYSPVRLKKICESFHKADFDFKIGNITDKMALDLFILETLDA